MTQNDFDYLKSALENKEASLLREIAENDALRKRVEEEARKKQEELKKQEETKKTKKEKSE